MSSVKVDYALPCLFGSAAFGLPVAFFGCGFVVRKA
jgi:hypothetical protein